MNLEVFYNGNNKILLPDRGGYRNEPFEDILFFKAISRHVEVNLINCRCYIANIANGKLDEILPKKNFLPARTGAISLTCYMFTGLTLARIKSSLKMILCCHSHEEKRTMYWKV